MDHKEKKITRPVAALIMAAVIACSFCACADSGTTYSSLNSSELEESILIKKSYKQVHQNLNRLLKFDISEDYYETAEITSDASSANAPAMIRIKVKFSRKEDLLNLLREKLGKEKNISADDISWTWDNQYAIEIKQSRSIKYFAMPRPGSSDRNDVIMVFMADKGSDTCLYVFE